MSPRLLSFVLIVLTLFHNAFLKAATPSLVSDYDLQLERQHDGQFIPLDDGSVLAVNVDRIDGVFTGEVAKLDATGEVLATFPGIDLTRGERLAATSLSDGRTVVVEATFSEPPLTARRADGTTDPDFTSPFDRNSASISGVYSADNGKFFVSGNFQIEGTRYQFAKLLPNGSLDESFDHDISGTIKAVVSDGPSHFLLAGAVAVQDFNFQGLQRITLNGDPDPDFEASGFANERFCGVQRLANGDLAYVSQISLGRANPDGTPSAAEVPDLGPASDLALKKSADGSLFVTGFFGEGGTSRRGVVKLTAEGVREDDFPELTDLEFEVLRDGSFLVVGDFLTYQEESRFGVARLDNSGNLINGFDQRFADEGFVSQFDRFSDGSIFVFGGFQRVIWDGKVLLRNGIAKLTPEGQADENFSARYDGRTPTLSVLLPDDRFLVRLGQPGIDAPEEVSWERYFSDGSPDPGLSPEVAAAYPLSSFPPGLAALNDGSISYFEQNGSRSFQHTLVSPGGVVRRAESYEPFDSLYSLVTDPSGTFYHLNGFGGRIVRAVSAEGVSLPGRGFFLPGPGNSSAQAFGLGLLPGRNLLVSGALSVTDRDLTLLDTRGTLIPQFEGKKIEGGIARNIFTFPESGQIFVAGTFQSYDGVARPGMAQVRMDGSLEPAFDLGSGPQYPPANAVPLSNGDLLIGGSGGLDHPFLIDGIARGGIARIRPVVQVVEPMPASPYQVSAAVTSALGGVLNWKASPETLGILIEQKRAGSEVWDLLATLAADVTHYEVDLTPAISYQFRISTYNLTGESPTVISLDVPEAVNFGGGLADRRIDLLDYARIDTIHRLESGKYLVGGRLNMADGQLLQESTDAIVVRVNSDGSYDESFQSFQIPNSRIRTLEELPDGKIWVGKSNAGFSQLLSNGELDETFTPVSLNREVTVIHSLPGEKVLVAGRFNNVDIPDDDSRKGHSLLILDRDGQVVEAPEIPLFGIQASAPTSEGGFLLGGGTGSDYDVVRFQADGTHDDSFLLQGRFVENDSEIRGLHELPTGEILVGGEFTFWRWNTPPVDGARTVSLRNLAVINPDGSLNLDLTSNFSTETDGDIEGIGSFPSGKALILGNFTKIAGESRRRLAIIGADGVLDEAVFDIENGRFMRAVETMSNGEVFPVGSYGEIGDVWRNGMARFSENGGQSAAPDSGFRPALVVARKDDVKGLSLEVSSSGELYVGGSFEVVQQGKTILSRGSLVRVLANGEIDSSYNPVKFDRFGAINALAEDSGGNLVIGGFFRTDPSGDFQYLDRLTPDGSLDPGFGQGSQPNSTVDSLLIHDDRIYLGGNFNQVGGDLRTGLARLESTGALELNFFNGSRNIGAASDITIHGDRVLAAAGRGLDVRNFRGETDDVFISEVEALGSAVRSFGDLGFAVMGQLRVEGDTSLPSIAMITTEPDIGVLWEETFGPFSSVSAYSKMPGSFYVSGNLVLGDRETSVVSIDPASGLRRDVFAAKANANTSAVERFGDEIVVAGSFTEWGEEARYGLAFLESATPIPAPMPSSITSVTASGNHTLLRWEAATGASSYHIEARSGDDDDWETVGYQNSPAGGFVISRGTDAGVWSYRVTAIGIDGTRSASSDPATPTEMFFGLWKVENGLAVDLGRDSDLDGDGIPLLVEYALDLDPNAFSKMPIPQLDDTTANYHIVSLRPDVNCLVQTSGDLVEWEPQVADLENFAMAPAQSISRDVVDSPESFYRVSCHLRLVRP